MHRLVPDFILQQCAAGRSQGAFRAAGMFVDVAGFSSMTDTLMQHGQHGAEVLAGVMSAAFAPLIRAVYEQGGFVATQAGDGFMALFPLGEHEQLGCRRALAAAWAVHERAASQGRHPTPYGAFTVSAKVGLAVGEVVWGIATADNGQRAAYYFSGPAVEGSVAAEHQARPGQMVMSAALAERLAGWVQGEPLGDAYKLLSVADRLPEPEPIWLPEVDLPLASRFFPESLLTQTEAGEFRQATCLFVSLPTVRTEAQLAVFMQTVYALQDRYGGLLRLQFGDKGAHLLLIWGAPETHENDIARALNFILDLQTQTAIPINGGVTHRIAYAGFVGSNLAEEYVVFGRGVNLAARFMTAAPRGELWLDEPAAQRAQAGFELQPLGEKTFKGFALPQKAYLLLERKEARDDPEEGLLLDRTVELQALDEFVQPIFAGRCAGALVVWGEPGMGKTRLVHGFLRALRRRQLTAEHSPPAVCVAQTDEILRLPFNAFRYWLRNYMGVSPHQVDARNKRSFNRALDELIAASTDERLVAELDRTRSFLGALLGLEWPDSLFEQLDAQGRYENTLIALITLLQAESRRRPLIFVLEDAHWLDADSRAFLPRLLAALTPERETPFPIAVLVTARPEGAVPPLDTFAYRQVDLSRLSQAALAALARDQLGAPASDQLLDLLEQRAEGNPFFAEQILGYLREEGRLVREADAWGISETSPVDLPSDVTILLVARLDRLAREVRDVVQTAAVLGREFDLRLLAAMRRDDLLVPEKVARAEQEAIWVPLGQSRYLFRHALLREAAYDMQLRARRQQLHLAAAETLESLYDAAVGSGHDGEKAYHYEAAFQHGADQARQPARQSLLKLAERAAREFENEAAIDFYSRGLALTEPDEADDRWTLLLGREAVFHLTGQRPAQAADLAALEALAEVRGQPAGFAEVALRQARHAQYLSNYDAASVAAARALRVAQAAGDSMREVAALADWARALIQLGDYAAARERLEAALAVSRSTEQTAVDGLLQRSLGIVAYQEGDYSAARAYTERALELARHNGDPVGECLALNNMGEAYCGWGDFAQAQRFAEQALVLARHLGNRQAETYALEGLGKCAEGKGDHAAARQFLEQTVTLAAQMGNRRTEASALCHLGDVWLSLGDFAAAQAALRQCVSICVTPNLEPWRLQGLAGLARVALTMGDLAQADTCTRELLVHLDKDGPPRIDQPGRTLYTCYQVLKAAGDPRALALLQRAYADLQARVSVIGEAQMRRTYLEASPWNRSIMAEYRQLADNGSGARTTSDGPHDSGHP